MKHFAEVLLQREYDLNDEVLAIETLFYKVDRFESIYDVFRKDFLSWDHRNNYINFDKFFKDTGLEHIVEKCNRRYKLTIEEYIFYCEYMLNILDFWKIKSMKYAYCIRDNISNVLEKLNYVSRYADGIYHIVEKSVLVSEVADIVQDNYELGESIYSFNYREQKGNLNKKSDILCRLYKYIESITPSAKQYGYSNLLNDIKDLSNKLDIRHTTTNKQETVIASMGKGEYESWLDELFKLSLTLIVVVDYTSKRKDINELKSKLG